jgi:YbbR domain-containing protein
MVKQKKRSLIRRAIGHKSFWGSFIFAFALWTYASLNYEYSTIVKVPLNLDLPVTRAIENPVSQEISVSVKGRGWDIFNLMFFTPEARVYVDLTQAKIEGSYEIQRNEIMRGIQGFKNVTPDNVIPEFITLQTGIIEIKTVPVIAKVHLRTREGFMIVGEPEIFPKEIEIRGNKKILKDIVSWQTQDILLDDLHKSVDLNLSVSDSLSSIVTVAQLNIRFKAKIEQYAETTLYDIPIQLMGGTPPESHKLMPAKVNITVRGGISVIDELSPDQVSASMDFIKILKDSSGVIIPDIQLPPNVQLLTVDPPWIYHLHQIPESQLNRKI